VVDEMPNYHCLRLGTSNSYLTKTSKGYILIDAGNASKAGLFQKKLKELMIDPKEILLIIITHVHYDHVGSLAEIQKITGAEVLVHSKERDLLQNAITTLPKGTMFFSRVLSAVFQGVARKRIKFAAVSPHLIIDNEFDLERYGVQGKVMMTPGHTAGSISVILESGEAFVGDTCFNVFSFPRSSVFPPYADNLQLLYESWKILLDSKAKLFLPGHGKPFTREKLAMSLQKRKRLNFNR
jgi:glyoxylase-like metal-dependent hydrolase (beta-lactamase superfamily II)